MENRYFTESELALLLSYSKWHLACSQASELPAVSPISDYSEWINQNSHKHPYREMFFVLAGDAFYSLNGVTYRCIPGTLFLIDANETHDFYYPPFAGNFKHLWFGCVKNTIIMRSTYSYANGKGLSEKNSSVTCRSHAGLSFLKKWDNLSTNSGIDKTFQALEMKYAWGNLITELCREGFRKEVATVGREQEYKEIIDTIVEHIRETAGKNLDWAKLARLSGYSKYHFSRLFKQHTGQTVHDFINTCRNERIKELIAQKFSQKEIAEELGFSCPSAFSRWRHDNGFDVMRE